MADAQHVAHAHDQRHPIRLLAVHEGGLAEGRMVGHQHGNSLTRHACAERAVGRLELALRPAGVPHARRQRGSLPGGRHEYERRDGVVGVQVHVDPFADHVVAHADAGASNALLQRRKLRPTDHRGQTSAQLATKALPGGNRVEAARQLARRRHYLALQPLHRVGSQPRRGLIRGVVGRQILRRSDRRQLPGQAAVGLDLRHAVDCHLLLPGCSAVDRLYIEVRCIAERRTARAGRRLVLSTRSDRRRPRDSDHQLVARNAAGHVIGDHEGESTERIYGSDGSAESISSVTLGNPDVC